MKYKRTQVTIFEDNGQDIRGIANSAELSRLTGVDRALISKARRNKYILSEEQYLKIKKALSPKGNTL